MSPMFELLGVSPQALFGQLLLGLINGAFYALLSLGLAVIFGLMNVINFTHGAQYMMGAFGAWMLLNYLGIPYWGALVLAPIIVGAFGVVIERLFISRLYHLDHLYGLLLTFGLAWCSRACSAASTASPVCRTPIRCLAAPTSASCSCPGIAPG